MTIEGSSIDPAVLDLVRAEIAPTDRVMVLLDSSHTKAHVRAELEAYGQMVTPGSLIVATDGIMHWLGKHAPRTQSDWTWNNPRDAAREFAAAHPEFTPATPKSPFNEGAVDRPVTYWPDGWLRRRG